MGVDQRRREARSRGSGGGGGNGRDGGRRCDLNQKDRTYRTRGTYSARAAGYRYIVQSTFGCVYHRRRRCIVLCNMQEASQK